MNLELSVPGLTCSVCLETVTKAVQGVDAMAQVTADPKTNQCHY